KKKEEEKKKDKPAKKANSKELEGKKSPPAEGDDAAKNGNGKTNSDNGSNGDAKSEQPEPEGKKTPSATDDEDEDNGDNGKDKEAAKETWYTAHAQATMDTQRHGPFPALYSGPRSLSPDSEWDTSITATIYLDARLWDCGNWTGDVVFDPEMA